MENSKAWLELGKAAGFKRKRETRRWTKDQQNYGSTQQWKLGLQNDRRSSSLSELLCVKRA
jgi:hypothetical protein